jgi:hypothetical protein
MDDAAPLDPAVEVVLNAADHGLGGPGKVGFLILWGDDDLEKALVAGLLPLPGNCTERMLLRQTEPFLARSLSFPPGAFPL